MSSAVPIGGAVSGRLDANGCLVAADPPLADLHRRAGGEDGGRLAVPQIASLARLARRLGILVSRPVVAADGDMDIDLIVRAEPDADGVKLSVSGWNARLAAPPVATDDDQRDHDFLRAGADWLWETDGSLRLTSVSLDAVPVIGNVDAFVGHPLTGLFRFVEGRNGELPILNALAEHHRFEDQAAVVRSASAPQVLLSGIPLIDGNGRFAGFRGVSVARHIDRAQAVFAAPIAGDMPDAFGRQLDRALRSPLDRIVAGAESIVSQLDGPIRRDYAEYAGDIASAGRHLLALVDDLVDLQAIERDDFAPDVAALDLADVARSAAGLLSVRASQKNIGIDRPPDDETLEATGDYKRVLQILVNLIGNAVRYSPEGSQVWIRCERESDLAAIIVADQGKGIAKDDHDRIFGKFERLAGNEPGTGLGLYIARRLARAMGGDVGVNSAPGQGARFILTLPVKD